MTTVTVEVQLTVPQLAAAFADLTDDDQAQVIIEVARIASEWDGWLTQWYAVGEHLRTCTCATPEARDLILKIVRGMGHRVDD